MNLRSPSLKYYVRLINLGLPYSFVRFGDGEWTAGILRDRPRTTSGSQALDIPRLQLEMRHAFERCHVAKNYIPALRETSLKREVVKWIERNVPSGVIWHDCRVFYLSSAHGELFPLIDALRNLEVPLYLVGPCRLWSLRISGILPNARVLVIPNEDCYVMKQEIMQWILDLPRPAFVGFTAGPATKVMIHQLYPVIGNVSWLIDFGSLWDVYVGHITRNYMKSMLNSTIQKNVLGP